MGICVINTVNIYLNMANNFMKMVNPSLNLVSLLGR